MRFLHTNIIHDSIRRRGPKRLVWFVATVRGDGIYICHLFHESQLERESDTIQIHELFPYNYAAEGRIARGLIWNDLTQYRLTMKLAYSQG